MGVKTISGFFLISILLIAGGCQVGGRQGVEDPPPYEVYFMEGVYSLVFMGFDPSFRNAVIKLWYVHGEEDAPIVLRNHPGRHAVLDPGGKGAGPSFMEAHISVLRDWKSAATWCTAQPAPGVILSRLRCTLTKAR
jgi:hypothetical protein